MDTAVIGVLGLVAVFALVGVAIISLVVTLSVPSKKKNK